MKNGSKSKLMLFVSVALLIVTAALSGCAHVKLPNQEVTVDAGKFGADAFYTHTNKERHLTVEEWNRERFGQFCFKPKGLAAYQAAVKSLCEETGRCDRETEEFQENLIKKANRAKNKTRVYSEALVE